MARVRLVSLDEMDPALRAAAERWRHLGGDINMFRAFAHMPDLFRRFLEFYGPIVNHGRVLVRVKELARIRIANLNQCHY
jgi:alkylhydroperoxidase family enzyme